MSAPWTETPIRGISCCCRPLTHVPCLRLGPRQWLNSSRKTLYSPVYEFATSGQLGITATGVALAPNGSFIGVIGIDYDLTAISDMLRRVYFGRFYNTDSRQVTRRRKLCRETEGDRGRRYWKAFTQSPPFHR